MLNATGSRAVRAFHGLAAAAVVLGWSVSATAGSDSSSDPIEITASASDPAGYIVLPKIIVQTSAGQLPPADNISVDTRIKLTNLDSLNPISVKCFFINSFPVCTGGPAQGLPCSSRDDCSGTMCEPIWDVGNFCVDLTVAQPTSWIASQGTTPTGQISPFGDPFEGELKCVQVNDCFENEVPVADNSLKAEATIIYAQRVPPIPPDDQCGGDPDCLSGDCQAGVCTCMDDGECAAGLVCAAGFCNQPPRIATAAYNAEGFQADTSPQCTLPDDCITAVCDNGVCTCADDADCANGLICDNLFCTTDPAAPMCLGDLPAGQPADLGCSQRYAPCPAVLILDHFFDHATPQFADQGNVVTTDLTLVPCSEDLQTASLGEQPTIVAQMLVYNEFEQKFSSSTKVQCFKQIQLSDIDTNPGPADDQWSLFSVFVQGTLVGQTRIRGVEGTLNAPLGNGLIGVAIEHYFAANNSRYLIEAADAFQLHGTGFRRRGDVVIKPGPF